jgi:biotin transport system substrate-specific component
VLLAAHLLLFVPGVAWLAGFVGWERAVAAGFLVFLPATLVKTALALAVLRAVRR